MLPALLFIFAQLTYAIFIIGVSSQPKTLSLAKHEVKYVLGISTLADDTTPASEPPPAPPATEPSHTEPSSNNPPPSTETSHAESSSSKPASTESTVPPQSGSSDSHPPPAEQPPPAPPATEPSHTEPSSNNPPPAESTAPSQSGSSDSHPPPAVEEKHVPGQEQPPESETASPVPSSHPGTPEDTGTIPHTPAPEESISPTITTHPTTLEESPTSVPAPNHDQSSDLQTEAILNPESSISNAEHIDRESVDKVEKEEASLSKTQTSDKKGELLITFAKDKVSDIEKNLKENDFATTTFATVRLTDEIDRATAEIEHAPARESEKLKLQISNFCREADLKLKNQELNAPEESEQDIEISRAKCLEYQ